MQPQTHSSEEDRAQKIRALFETYETLRSEAERLQKDAAAAKKELLALSDKSDVKRVLERIANMPE